MALLLLFACDTDTGTGDTGEPAACDPATANTRGTITLGDCDDLPSTIEIWTAGSAGDPCYEQWMAYDSAGNDGGWEDWRGELVDEATVSTSGTFSAQAGAGPRVAFADWGCYACAEFTATTDDCVDVELEALERMTADAPNVYLYPEVATDVTVRVGRPAAITAASPPYPRGGWTVRADPSGLLHTRDGEIHDYLFYEVETSPSDYQFEEGWCVPGPLAQATVEDAMLDLGFTAAELGDFRDYWDAAWPGADRVGVYPQLQLPRLDVQPEPDTLLRAWFVVTQGCAAVRLPELPALERLGFVATEWGVVVAPPLPRVDGWFAERRVLGGGAR